MALELTTFVRKPFLLEAIEVTVENIGEIAKEVGILRKKKNGDPYIQVDSKRVPSIYRVYPGFWMTKMDDNIRCYSGRTFKEQFVENNPDIEKWVDFMNQESQVEAVGET